MGFIDYAWAVSLQKDNTKVKILQDPTLNQPELDADSVGFTVKLPTVQTLGDGSFSYLGHIFPPNNIGKTRIGRLFRASVLHLTTHTLAPFTKDRIAPKKSDAIVETFAKALINDVYVNAYIQAWYPDRFFDLAYANTLAFQKIKSSERIFTSSTKLMAALLTKLNVGLVKNSLGMEEDKTVTQLCAYLGDLKEIFLSSIAGDLIKLDELFDEKLKGIKLLLDPFGPFLEAPSLRHTESTGQCSIYSETTLSTDDFEGLFVQSVMSLGGEVPTVDNIDQCWRPEQEAESLQAFNSDHYQKQREEKILSKIKPYVSLTRFKGVSIPEEDYTQYLRARSLVQGASRRLLDILRSAFNYLDEDPRQEMGQLDLAAVIQSLASNKPATDVFSLDEYLQPSYAWSIVFDVSNSMQVKGEYGRALAIAVAEAARELMTDPTSWTFFAFNDKLHILKDSTESYSKKVRARIGGLKFDGLTYIPDAVQIAGKMLAKRFEEQRCLIVISDGWPYGYVNMPVALKECVDELLRKGVIVLGIGVETDRMSNFFNLHSSIYRQKDLINKFGSLYASASAKALET
ncbi:MAG TPA: VWA domain-containing protein [Candidatus Nanoarchaeia archaeon]|nr:VWA domain-containing protein [Candidatus Nanoarchaeia archaeon]